MNRTTIHTATIVLIRWPGNGTRYEIYLTRNPFGGYNWAWIAGTTTFYAGWASPGSMGEVKTSGKKLGRADRAAIELIIEEGRFLLAPG